MNAATQLLSLPTGLSTSNSRWTPDLVLWAGRATSTCSLEAGPCQPTRCLSACALCGLLAGSALIVSGRSELMASTKGSILRFEYSSVDGISP